VAFLAGGRQAAGAHAATWNGRDAAGAAAASGVYFIRLSAPGEEAAARVFLFRR